MTQHPTHSTLTSQPSETPVNMTVKLQHSEEKIRKYENATTAVQTRVEGYRQQHAQIGAEIQAMGVNPQTIENELAALAQEILTRSEKLDELLPDQLIEQMQQDLNRPIQAPVNLPDFGITF